jgi:hypothetical protein
MGGYRAGLIMKVLMILFFLPMAALAAKGAMKVRIGTSGQFIVDGKTVFPIGFTTGPPTGAKAPDGNNAFAELAKNGFVFFQWLSHQKPWGPGLEAEMDSLLQEANQNGIKVAPSVAALTVIHPGDQHKRAQLESVIRRYRNNPAIFLWKGADEPAWGRIPPKDLGVFYDTVHKLDPNHPVWITQAPIVRNVDSALALTSALRPYAGYYDVGAIDIYPIKYPPRTYSIPNLEISSVGDYTTVIRNAGGSEKGLMMTLQICFSGVAKPGRTLRFPTFPQERYMSYEAIINGARALLYFGGELEPCLSNADRPYGWNWRFYHQVLEPVLEEFRPQSPLYPALTVPNSSLPLHVEGGSGLEFTVREAGDYLYILAAKREGEVLQFTFSGLPHGITDGEVLFESPRHVKVEDGKFTDWFAPHDVHVYRFRRSG